MKVLVILSGGMDSTVALHNTLSEGNSVVKAITFNYGSKHSDREIKMAIEQCRILGVSHELIDITQIGKHLKSDLLKSGGDIPDGHYEDGVMKKTVVPFRNGIMLSIAAGIAESCGAKAIVLGNHFGDHAIYPDCRDDFAKSMRMAINLGTYENIDLHTPFQKITKAEIAVIGNKLGVDFSKTYSCYKGGEKHCGTCGTCVERKEAFDLSKIIDPTEYL